MTSIPISYFLLITKSKYPITFVVFNLVLYSVNIFTSNYSDFMMRHRISQHFTIYHGMSGMKNGLLALF